MRKIVYVAVTVCWYRMHELLTFTCLTPVAREACRTFTVRVTSSNDALASVVAGNQLTRIELIDDNCGGWGGKKWGKKAGGGGEGKMAVIYQQTNQKKKKNPVIFYLFFFFLKDGPHGQLIYRFERWLRLKWLSIEKYWPQPVIFK